jgi:hypothetical protein
MQELIFLVRLLQFPTSLSEIRVQDINVAHELAVALSSKLQF